MGWEWGPHSEQLVLRPSVPHSLNLSSYYDCTEYLELSHTSSGEAASELQELGTGAVHTTRLLLCLEKFEKP